MQPSDPALSRVAADNAASLRVVLGRANGWAVLRNDAVSAISNAQPRHHRAVVTDPSVAQRDIATVLDEFFDADVSRYVIEDPWGRDWSAAGFESHTTMAIMACHARQRPRGSDDLEIVEVSTVARLGEFERTLVDAFPLLDHRPGRPGALWTPGVLELTDLRLLLGLRDGAPIATACAWVHDGVVGVYWIAVQPHHHGRGYGSALTATALTPGTHAVLVATQQANPCTAGSDSAHAQPQRGGRAAGRARGCPDPPSGHSSACRGSTGGPSIVCEQGFDRGDGLLVVDVVDRLHADRACSRNALDDIVNEHCGTFTTLRCYVEPRTLDAALYGLVSMVFARIGSGPLTTRSYT